MDVAFSFNMCHRASPARDVARRKGAMARTSKQRRGGVVTAAAVGGGRGGEELCESRNTGRG